jgi:hypothetical protein
VRLSPALLTCFIGSGNVFNPHRDHEPRAAALGPRTSVGGEEAIWNLVTGAFLKFGVRFEAPPICSWKGRYTLRPVTGGYELKSTSTTLSVFV